MNILVQFRISALPTGVSIEYSFRVVYHSEQGVAGAVWPLEEGLCEQGRQGQKRVVTGLQWHVSVCMHMYSRHSGPGLPHPRTIV